MNGTVARPWVAALTLIGLLLVSPVEAAPGPSDEPDAVRAVTVERVTFKGNTVVSTEALARIAAPYLGRPVSPDALEELRLSLTRHYTEQGFINSGVLWAGDSTDGMLTFDVVEGRLSAIHLNGMAGLDERYVTRRLSRAADGPLNMNILRERFQLLLTDPLFQSLNARVLPGAQPGEARLEVDVLRARPYQFTVFANNYRPPSIGADALGVSASVRNLSGRGDVLDATLQMAPQSDSGGRASVAWQMPLGFDGTRFTLALDHGSAAVVEQPAAALDIASTLSSLDLGISHPFSESLQQKFTLGLNHVRRENRSSLLGSPFSFTPNEPEGVTRESLWRFWQDYNHRTSSQVIALRSTFTTGHNNLQDATGQAATDSPPRSFRLWLGQLQWARQVLDQGAQLVVRATLQRSADRLLALDGLAVGGVNSVRGYRENQLVRDQGGYLNLEFDYPLLRQAATGLSVNLIPFLDYGAAHNLGGPTDTLASVGLAGRLQYQGFNVDLVLAKRLKQVEALSSADATLQDHGIHLQLSYKF